MFGLFKKSGPSVGIEINSSSISLLQLEKVKSELKIARFATAHTPPDAVREGLISDPQAVGAAVRALLDSVGLTAETPTPTASFAIPGQSVAIRLLPVPKDMPAEELSDVVQQEAINSLPFPVEEACLDWTRIPSTAPPDPDGVEREDILLAAIQKAVVAGYEQMAEEAGIKLGNLEISSLATIRALAFAGQLGKSDSHSLIVNVRQDATDITLVQKAVPLFSRTVLLGVETMLEAIQRSVNSGAEESKQLLSKVQLLGVPTVDARMAQAGQVVRSICGDLTEEVGRSLEFHMSQRGMVRVDNLIVCGPGTVLTELGHFIGNRLSLNAAVANPFHGLTLDPDQIPDSTRPHYATLAGLVFEPETAEYKTAEINLNQPTGIGGELISGEGDEIATPWLMPALGVGVGVAAITVLAWAYFQYLAVPKKISQAESLDEEIASNKKKIEQMEKGQADVTGLQARKNALEEIIKHGTPVTITLQALRNNMPKGVSLSSLKVEGSSVAISGSTADFSKASQLCINLQGSNYFSNVDIESIKRFFTKPAVITYRLNTTLSPDLNKQSITLSDIDKNGESQSSAAKVLSFCSLKLPVYQQIKAAIDQVQQKFAGQLQFETVDVDNPESASVLSTYGISPAQLPVLLFVDPSGKVSDRLQSFDGKPDSLLAACDKLSKLASSSTPTQ